MAFTCTEAAIKHVLCASQETRVDISGKVTSISSSGGTGSSSSSSSSTATGEETSPHDNYDSYGDYETYYDEATDTPQRVTISTDTGAKLDLELEGKVDHQSGTGMHISTSGVGTSITINKTKLVSEMAASPSSPVDR